MYVVTIIKTKEDNNIFCGFDSHSLPILKGDLINELLSYGFNHDEIDEFINIDKGSRYINVSKWKGFYVHVTIFRFA